MENRLIDQDVLYEESLEKILAYLEEKKYFKARDELLRFNEVDIAELLEEVTEEAGLQRIEAYLNRRVFPPMIHMIQPQLEFVPKFKSEEDMLRDKLKRARREAKRTERQVAKVKMQEMREAHRKKKEERDKTWKENIAMLEAGRTDDLNMAAAPAQGDEEESSFSEEESE